MLLEKPLFSTLLRDAGCRGKSIPSNPAGAAASRSQGRQLAGVAAAKPSDERRGDGLGCALAMLVAAVWTQATFYFRPDALFTDLFVLHDHGQNLFLIDELRSGHWLYRDVASAYGPLPTLVHYVAARVFGNTAATYLHLWQVLTVVGAGLLFILLRRVASRGLTLLWLTLVVFPYFLMPTAARSVLAYTLYPGFERLALLGLALLWRPPAIRGARRTLGLGALLGGTQLVKFGIAVPAGIALLAADCLATNRAQARGSDRRSSGFWLRQGAGLLAGFLLVEATWIVALLLILPPSQAAELLWPWHMLGSYQSYVTPDLTYLGSVFAWRDLRYFFEQQIPGIAAAGLALSFVARWLYRWARERNLGGLAVVPFRKVATTLPATGDAAAFGGSLLLAVYFPVAIATIAYPQWVGAQSEWALAAAALAGFVLLRRSAITPGKPRVSWPGVMAAAAFICFLPSAFASIGQLWQPTTIDAAERAQPAKFANGETLWLTPPSRAAFEKIQAVLTHGRITPPKVLAVPMAAGWHHYFGYGLPAGTRQRWIMAGFVPRAEEADVLRALADSDALIFVSRDLLEFPVGPDPASWRGGHNPGFRPETNTAFRRLLGEPTLIDDRVTVFPVRHDTAAP